MIDEHRNRRYLLEKTQHLVGGFGKGVGDLPGEEKSFPQAAQPISANSN